MEDMLSVQDAAKLLGVTGATVRHHIATGRLPATKIHPQLWLLRRADVEAFTPLKVGWQRGQQREGPRGKRRTPTPPGASGDA